MSIYDIEKEKTKLSYKIAFIRFLSKKSKKEVAKHLGMSTKTYSNLESQKSVKITFDQLLTICNLYNITVEDLLINDCSFEEL